MFKRIFQIGCLTAFICMMSFPVWADTGMNHSELLARSGHGYGHGPGDGSGNGGSGPHDGTGNGSGFGDCLFPDANMTTQPFVISRGGHGGGHGGHGPGDGSGNGGSGPRDGSGNGSKSGTCINL